MGWLLIAAFLVASWWLFGYRDRLIDEVFGEVVGCEGCFSESLMLHDTVFFAALTIIAILGFCLRNPLFYVPLRLLAIAGLLLYAIDVMVFEQFFSRLNFADLRAYAGQAEVIWTHAVNTGMVSLFDQQLVVLLALVTCVFLFWPGDRRNFVGFLSASLVLPAGLVVADKVFEPTSYVHDWALRNVVEFNVNTGVSVPYSEETVNAVLARQPDEPYCNRGKARRDNLLVLILESWSPYQSALFSGLRDWTPGLDEIARRHRYYTRFHAAGFTTNEGLMSLFTGMEILSPVKSFFAISPFETAWGHDRTLPKILIDKDYHTAFLTSGDLSFSRKGDWLEHIGFDYIEGHDHPDYEGLERLHFNSVPDDVLYERVLDYLATLDSTSPWFVAIESVSSHHPFVHPYTRARDEEAVFRYMDEAATAFYRALRAADFFEHGRLVIISDHRAMIPIYPEERTALGQAAPSLIPAIVVDGREPSGAVREPFHQSDLMASIDWLTGREACSARGRRDIFAPGRTRPRCLFHARGSNRDHIDAFCPDGEAVLKLNGDGTRVIKSHGLSTTRKEEITAWLNRYRIRAQQHHADYLVQNR